MKYGFYLCLIVLYSCSSKKPNHKIIGFPKTALCDTNSINKYLATASSKEVHNTFNSILKKGNDSCSLLFLERVCSMYVDNPIQKNFDHFNEVSCLFDGFISEYFVDLLPSFFKPGSDIFLRYLFRSSLDSNKNGCAIKQVQDYLSLYDSDKKIQNIIKSVIQKTGDKEFKLFLNRLVNDLNK